MRSSVLLLCVLLVLPLHAQQVVDPDFIAIVEKPAYSSNGPVVAIDETHANFHTAGGQYKPFADLLSKDGYSVKPSTKKFAKGAFAGIDVLVIANALSANASQANQNLAAFTDEECDAVRDWVREGGSLLLISDHAPFGGAAENLGKRFGVEMGKGWAFDRVAGNGQGVTTQLTFSRENGLLGTHPILLGRNAAEQVKTVRSFTGQSLSVPSSAIVLLKLSQTTREAPTTNEMNQEEAAIRAGQPFGTHSSSAAGRAQGLAMTFGKGRLVVLGEAGMFSAQIARFTENGQQYEIKFGMNTAGHDDRQFALNVLHWLSGVLK